METLRFIAESLQPQTFLSSINLTEAYLHIPIHESHGRFLCFWVGEQHFQFQASWPFLHLQSFFQSNCKCNFSSLLSGDLYSSLLGRATQLLTFQDQSCTGHIAIRCLQDLSFLVNISKSSLIPTQQLEHLRIIEVLSDQHQDLETEERLHMWSRAGNCLMKLMGLLISDTDIIQSERLHLQQFLWTFQQDRNSREGKVKHSLQCGFTELSSYWRMCSGSQINAGSSWASVWSVGRLYWTQIWSRVCSC